MRIAILTPGGVDRSGTERVIPCLLWLIEGLVAAGHDVQVFALRQEPAPGRWPLLGAQVHNIGRKPAMSYMLAKLLAEHRRKPFDVIHAFWAQGCGTVGGIAGAILGVRFVLTLAGGDLEAIPDIAYGGRLGWRGRVQAAIACRLADCITAPSQQLCHRAKALGIEALHLPLGVSLDRWPPSPPRRRDMAEPIRLLHVASLNRVKDQHMLLRAAGLLVAERRPFELTIIGEDTLGGTIQQEAAALGLDGVVHFTGFLPHHQLRAWIEQSDVLVVTSRHEAGPLVMLEAAIAGVPTLGTAVGHIADFAPTAALAVPVGDSEAFAAGVVRLAHDEALRLSLASEAQTRGVQMDARVTVQTFCTLYAGPDAELQRSKPPSSIRRASAP